ncbi:MAG: hypothetical protein QG594_507, partial [Bacteroidota bacterium]|nr:hypothetical protein [Bacteroidota bacterium]
MQNKDWSKALKRVIRFFSRQDERGYGFCIAQNEHQISQINAEIKSFSQREVVVVELNENYSIIDQLKQKITSNNVALIINNLDYIINTKRSSVEELNFSREALNRLEVPIIFWLTEKNLSIVSNQASDLFSQRHLATLYFPDFNLLELPKDEPIIDVPVPISIKENQEIQNLQLKITTFESQLQQALQENLSHPYIASNIVLPLIEAKAEMQQTDEVIKLIKKWESNFTNPSNSLKIGIVLEDLHQYEDAFWYLNKVASVLQQKKLGQNQKDLLSVAYSRLGSLNSSLGNLNKALDFFEKDLELQKELYESNPNNVSFKNGLAISY